MMAAMRSTVVMAAWSLAALTTASMAGQPRMTTPDPDLGISEGLARERSARISNLRYDLAFTIPAARLQPVGGRALIRFSLASAVAPLVLDYLPDRAGIVRSVEANGVKTAI